MASFADQMRDLSADLAEEMGAPITYERVTKGEYDPALGKTVEEVEEIEAHGTFAAFALKDRDSSLVEEGDVRLLLPARALDGAPKRTDRVSFDGESWSIAHIEPIYAGDAPSAYWLILRR